MTINIPTYTASKPQDNNDSSKQQQPLVFVVILHWRALDHTRACLESVEKLTYGNFQILIVDNGSELQESKSLVDGRPNCHWLPLPENMGFAGGCNQGVEYALEHNASFVWLLNNDTVVETNSLSELISVAKNNPQSGALGAMVSDMVTKTKNGSIGVRGPGHIDYLRGKAVLRITSQENPVKCEWLAASNLLLRATAIHETGGFDENYFLYFEDTELCHRLNIAGWQCLFVPHAKIRHVGGASTEEELKHWRAYYHTRNRLLFFGTYLLDWRRIPAFFFIWGHLLRHCLSLPFRGVNGREQLQAEILGATDYLFRRFGKATCLDD